MNARAKEKTYQYFCLIVCLLTAIICAYPLLYTLMVSLCPPDMINTTFILPLPTQISVKAYMQVLTASTFIVKAMLVSVFRTVVGTALSVVLCAAFAFSLSRKKLPGRKYIMYLLIFIILFNGGLIPTYLAIKQMNLLDNIWVYIFPNLINAWNVIIIKQFIEAIPKEIEESAQIDGANELSLFFKVIMPMSNSVIAAMAIFTLVGQWNSWFDAMLYVSPAKSYLWPLQYYATISFNNLNQINQGDLSDLENMLGAGGLDDMSVKMALTIVTCLPILIVYPFFQKYFTKGVYLGAVKG